MKYKDWSSFRVDCYGIGDIMTRPQNVRGLTKAEKKKYAALSAKEELSEAEQADFAELIVKLDRYAEDYDLSATAIEFLLRRYAWQKYNKKVAPTGFARSSMLKGNELEADAIKLLAKIDGIDYRKADQPAKNEHIVGRCDIWISEEKVIDTKVSWSVNTFLPKLQQKLDKTYWFQMQGYMELYNVDRADVCFVLLNTPPYLVDREAAKYTEKYVFGEISRERYENEMEKLDLSFNYDIIPQNRRVIRHIVHRYPDIMPVVYKRVNRCREWLNNFERLHINNKPITISPESYVIKKENLLTAEPAEPREGDEG